MYRLPFLLFLYVQLKLAAKLIALPAGFLLYASMVLAAVFVLIFRYVPQYGQTHIMCYIGVCSLVGSISVRCGISVIVYLLNFLIASLT